MSAANVKFSSFDDLEAAPGQEQTFSFDCPKHNRRCWGLCIHGRTDLKHDPQGKNGGVAHWHWDGNREAPTFTPSIDHGGCWHGYIENGRCVDTSKQDEPDIRS